MSKKLLNWRRFPAAFEKRPAFTMAESARADALVTIDLAGRNRYIRSHSGPPKKGPRKGNHSIGPHLRHKEGNVKVSKLQNVKSDV